MRRLLPLRPDATSFATVVHLHDGRIVVELERRAERPEDFEAATPLQAQDAKSRLRAAVGLSEAATIKAAEIRRMTGFERVLVYRFDLEWNGEAIAEDRLESWPQSLLGLRFPASDIPARARALYTRSPARFAVDRDAVPAGVFIVAGVMLMQARAISPEAKAAFQDTYARVMSVARYTTACSTPTTSKTSISGRRCDCSAPISPPE